MLMNETLAKMSYINENKQKNLPPLSWNGTVHFELSRVMDQSLGN